MQELPEWFPDRPAFNNAGLTDCLNCIPAVGSYQSFPTSAVFSSALDSGPSGSWSGYSNTGGIKTVVGTVNKLWNVSNSTPVDISGAVYNAYLPNGAWSFARYLGKLYATNGEDPIQVTDLDTLGTFAVLGATIPKARQFCIAKDFLVLADTIDTIDGEQIQRVWWSSIGDPSQFPTPGGVTANQTQSSYVNLNDAEGGKITAIYGGDDLTILLERSIWKGQYIGGNFVWQFTRIDAFHGMPLVRTSRRVGNIIYFLGEGGFYSQQGGGPAQPIGVGKVDKFFYAQSSSAYRYLSHTAIEPSMKVVIWMFPGLTQTGCTEAMVYHWEAQRWSRLVMTEGFLFYSATRTGALTLEQLDAYGTMDSLPYSLDSSVWEGGGGVTGVLSGMDTSFRVVQYTGTALAALIETAEVEAVEGARSQINGVRPVVNGGATITVQIGTRNLQSSSVSYSTAATVNSDTGWHNFRQEGRYHRIRINTTGAFTHLVGYDVDVVKGGVR